MQRRRPGFADLLRAARLQFRRSRNGAGNRQAGYRGFRNLPLRHRAVRLMRRHAEQTYPQLFDVETEPSWHARASGFASRVRELTAFLADDLGVDFTGRAYPRRVTYHDSCSSIWEMGVASQPRKLLKSLDGMELVEMSDRDVCCGFGGAFSIKYPEISNAIVSQKVDRFLDQSRRADGRRSRLSDEHCGKSLPRGQSD